MLTVARRPQVLKFLFALPPRRSDALVTQMLGLVMAYIDLLGGLQDGTRAEKAV